MLAGPHFMHVNLKEIKHTLFPGLQPPKASVLLASFFSFDWLPSLRFILRFLNANYMRCTFLVLLQPLKTTLLPFFKHFNIQKDQRYLASCLFVSQYLNSSISMFLSRKCI